ncbi:MAG: hypothetical protein AB8F34_05605 [Akkermansiaceae bacterium]
MLILHGQTNSTSYAEAYLTNKYLIPGEQTLLWVSVQGGRPDSRPLIPEVDGAVINFAQEGVRMGNNRELTQVFIYRVSAPNAGKYIIPPISLSSGGKRLLTDPLVFNVAPLSQLKSIPTGIGNNTIKIGWFPEKTTLYQGEVCPVVLKVYAPSRLRVANFGLPDPQKENCLAWRFSLPNRRQSSTTTIDGETHEIMRYATTLSGIAAGKATLGPSKLRLIIRERVIDPRFGPRLSEKPVHLTLPKLDFTILPLPDNAPKSFTGAIGRFQITATTDKTELKDTDSTEVILHIDGTGNLPTVKPPTLSDDTWKVIDTAKVTRGEERRFTSGRVTYRQLLRPTSGSVTAIPYYEFSYFDPSDKKYYEINTPAIPVSIIATNPSPAATQNESERPNTNTPPEKMKDILGFIDKPASSHSTLKIKNSNLWHLMPAALALLIIGYAARQRQQRKRLLNPDADEKKQALGKLAEAPDTRTFYRRAGRIIDRWHHSGAGQESLAEIIAERNAICFQPDGTPVPDIAPDRKTTIINLLKRSTKTIILLSTIFITADLSAQDKNSTLKTQNSTFVTARDAWKTGNYQQAIDLYKKQYPDPNTTPADISYNLGNCHHRLGEPGLAALAWRRALVIDPTHKLARKNLRFIEIDQNANVPETFAWQSHLAITSSGTYYFILYACGWIIVLATLFLLLNLSKKRILTGSIITICLAALIVCASAFAIFYYPDGYRNGDIEKQAVIISTTPLYEEAHRSSSNSTLNTQNSTLKLAPASLVRVNASRGPWLHITTFDEEEGWVEVGNISRVIKNK